MNLKHWWKKLELLESKFVDFCQIYQQQQQQQQLVPVFKHG